MKLDELFRVRFAYLNSDPVLMISVKIAGVGSHFGVPLKSSDDEPSVGGRICVAEVVAAAADFIFLRSFADTRLAPYNGVDLLSSLLDVIDSGNTVLMIELP